MRFSVWPINQQPIDSFLEVCRHAERTGWDGVWISDHLMPSREPLDIPVLECFVTAAAVAASTTRISVGTLVASNTFRHPAVVAKMTASIAQLSHGRFVLGLGAGWQPNEHTAHGIDLPSPARRLAALDEACSLISSLLSGEQVDHRGRHYIVDRAIHRPTAATPILIGAKGLRALEVVARRADIWNTWGLPDVIAERSADLDRHCVELGRDPGTLRRTAQALVVLADGDREPELERWQRAGLPLLAGDAAHVRNAIAHYRTLGVDEFIVPDFNLGDGADRLQALDRIMDEVARPFRSER